jgi:hypothetical protein
MEMQIASKNSTTIPGYCFNSVNILIGKSNEKNS